VSGWRERLARLAAVRVAGTQLAILATLSLTSTGLVVVGALASDPPSTVLAALAQHGVVVHRQAAASPAPVRVSGPAPTPSAHVPTHAASVDSSGDGGDGGGDTTSTEPTDTTPTVPPTTTPSKGPPQGTKIKHVFVISLTSSGYDATFGTAAASTYLAHDLVPRGVLLTQYATLDDASLPNALALVSGQPPNAQTQQECPTYSDVPASARPADDGSITDPGCVYPVNTLTLADQLGSAGRTWRAYVEGTGHGKTCRRPAAGAADATLALNPADPYATRDNPFVYFHSLLDLGDCATNDVDLDVLEGDLAKASDTPNVSFIVPDRCHDGSADACAAGQPGGAAAADAFLAAWVPKILASPAYKQDGLLVIAFGGVRPAPVPPAGTTTTTPSPDPAGTRHVGALLVSQWTKPASTDASAGGPYALLRTLEDLFGLTHLARAGGASVHSYAPPALGEQP
jgi:hypothetical protein